MAGAIPETCADGGYWQLVCHEDDSTSIEIAPPMDL